ncbi:MAG: HD-GYP domain-containing protein [Actinomycetota bacterium]
MPEKLIDAWRSPRGVWRLGAASVVILLLGAGAWLVAMTHDPSTPLMNVMVVPILVAALFFQTPGGMVAGAVAGLLVIAMFLDPAGPPVFDWLLRGGFFILVGGLAGHVQRLLDLRLSQGRELVERLSAVHARALSTFATTVDLRDGPTGGHSARVAHNAYAVAVALELDGETAQAVYWSGLLHDLGKIAIPERIMQKPGRLTAAEMEVMRRHANIGADLLLSVSADLEQIADAVRSHHERWDGSGYPRGLAGEAIPFTGRILSVVDVFEALTCERPYRRACEPQEVLALLRREAGIRFDPRLVALFEDLYWQGALYTALGADPLIVEGGATHPHAGRRLGALPGPTLMAPRYQLGSSGRP